MSQEGITSGMCPPSNIAQALMEEDLEREIARNQAANRMAKEREEQAMAARKRAEESQKCMQDMMNKYELMRAKLEFTQKHLDETNTKITYQEKITEKIQMMKDRVEQYTSKREAVDCLNEAVKMKAMLTDLKMVEDDHQEFEVVVEETQQNSQLMNKLKTHMEENEARIKKREELKVWLEEQVARGEKRAVEQSRIAKAKEDLLELKLRELKLQTQRLERKKEQQQRAEMDNQDFLNLIDKELEEMEARTVHKEEREEELARLTAHREKLDKARNIKLELQQAREKTRLLETALKEKKAKMAQSDPRQAELKSDVGDGATVSEGSTNSPAVKEATNNTIEATKDALANTPENTGAIPKNKPKKNSSRNSTPKLMSPTPLETPIKQNSPIPLDARSKLKSPTPEGTLRNLKSPTPETSNLVQKLKSPAPTNLNTKLEPPTPVTPKSIESIISTDTPAEPLLPACPPLASSAQKTDTHPAVLSEEEPIQKAPSSLNSGSAQETAPSLPSELETAPAMPSELETAPALPSELETAPALPSELETAPALPSELETAPASATASPAICLDKSSCPSYKVCSPEPRETNQDMEGGDPAHCDLSATVRKLEGKCASVKGDLAEMAMSEQYLRTKQAMLLAKKKEREMMLAESIANLREAEVGKLKEKVQHMQELLAQRKEKLKIQEQMMKEKNMEKMKMDKIIEARRRRGNYCEKELIERVIFDKEPPKKK